MPVMQVVPGDDPLRVAWDKYKASDRYKTTKKWAAQEEHLEGSLWAVFSAGFSAAERRK